MGQYSNLTKLARVKLPSGTTYALIDADGRSLITGNYATTGTYAIGDYVIYKDDLYRCISPTAGEWDSTKWSAVTISKELKDIKATISSGIHYRGYTTTSLYEGATTNPILINGAAFNCESGDLVIETPPEYAVNTAYHAGEFVSYGGVLYQVLSSITAADNKSWADITKKIASSNPEFLFDGTKWNEIGSFNPQGLGALAFKDSATGNYTKPTGTGSVTVPSISSTSKKLTTVNVTLVDGTVSASEVTEGEEKDIAKAGEATVYGTANVGAAVVYGTANRAANATTVGNANVGAAVIYGKADRATEATTVGNANVGTAVVYGKANVGTEIQVGTALGGTTEFNTDAIKSATLTGTTTFNTDAIKSATLGGSTQFTLNGITASVDGDCLNFVNASTGTVTLSTEAASTGSVGIDTTAATKSSVTLTTSGITPAAAAPDSQTLTPAAPSSTAIYGAVDAPSTQTLTPATESTSTIYGAETSTSTLTPAEAAPNTQTIIPAVANGKLKGSYTINSRIAAKAATGTTTVATGQLEDGNQLVSAITVTEETKEVTVGTTTDTVTVQ